MKAYLTASPIIAALAASITLLAATNGADASTVIRRGGNVVHAQVYDSAGKRVNRLPARSYGAKPVRMGCVANKCRVLRPGETVVVR